jgi:hypothetical protein
MTRPITAMRTPRTPKTIVRVGGSDVDVGGGDAGEVVTGGGVWFVVCTVVESKLGTVGAGWVELELSIFAGWIGDRGNFILVRKFWGKEWLMACLDES